MICSEFRDQLTVWVDGEMPMREVAEFELHLTTCPECRHLAEQERGQLEWFRRVAPREPIPAVLRARLLALVRDEHSVPRARRIFGVPLMATAGAALLLAGIVVSLNHMTARKDHVEWCQTFIDDHQENILAVGHLEWETESASELSSRLSEALKHPLYVPRIAGARLLGGRRCVLHGHSVGLAIYETAEGHVSFFVTPREELHPPGWKLSKIGYHTAVESGFSLAAWEGKDGMLNVLVAQSGVEKLVKMAERFRDLAPGSAG